MEIFTIDAIKINGECYTIIDKNTVIVPPIIVDSNTTVITTIVEGMEIKISNSIEELTNELLLLGYTIPDNNFNIEEHDNNY